jgi:hypothetical protein
MVLRFTGKQVNTSYSSEQIFVMLFLCNSFGAGGGSAGLSGLLSNYDAYQRWVRAAHERVQFVKGALAMVDMLADDSDAKKHFLLSLAMPPKTHCPSTCRPL